MSSKGRRLGEQDLKQPADHQKVDLRNLTVDVEPQVVDRHPVPTLLEVEVELVRRVGRSPR